jgi:hypothetical protein
MGLRAIQWIVAVAVVLALNANEAQAAGADCRRVPVYTAPCFSRQQPSAGCAAISDAKAPCFTVHGLLQGSNGVPGIRMWRIGTRRVLGIVGGDGSPAADDLVPRRLYAQMQTETPGWLRSVDAQFRVCPLATEKAGWMQPVCIVSASHVVFTRRHYGFDPPRAPAPPPPSAAPAGSRSPLAPR